MDEDLGTKLSERGLERRLKRYVLKETHAFLAVCPPGLEQVLAAEVQQLPRVSEIATITGGATFSGPIESIYHANLQLATAHRVLWRVADFLAQSYPMLYNKAAGVPWERYLGFNAAVRFNVSCRSSRLHHQPQIANTLLSAMQHSLAPLGLRVEQHEDAAIEVYVRLFRDRCTLSVNTSGPHLHRRGYRTYVNRAPLRETLAAGILKLAQADTADLILDPMCGSGTFLLEAARTGAGILPGATRSFAFEHLPFYKERLWRRIREEACQDASLAPHPKTTLLGFDIDAATVRAAEHNAVNAGVEASVQFAQGDATKLAYEDIAARYASPLLICNPPFGKRLEKGKAAKLYAELAKSLKKSKKPWRYALLCPQPSWWPLAVAHSVTLSTGGLPITLLVGSSQPGSGT